MNGAMGKRGNRWDSSSDEEDHHRKHAKRQAVSSKHSDNNINGNDQNDDGSAKIAAAAISSSKEPVIQLHNPLLHGCRSVYDTYERMNRISEGTYGIVWKARYKATNEIVALKQIKFDVFDEQSTMITAIKGGDKYNPNNEGFPISALREINVLLALSHESIVNVKEMVVGDGMDKVFMVMELFEFDLKEGLSRFQGALAQSELKSILVQIMQGVEHMHGKWFIHRDLKPSNVLVHRSGRVALADFGLARRYETPQQYCMTQLVVTLWYRSPELLFGENRYGPPIDMWSVGCILGELIRKEPVFQGQGELDQIDQIFAMVGVPDKTSWASFDDLPNAGLFRWKPRKQSELLLPKMFPIASSLSMNQAFLDSNGFDLLCKLLTLSPSKRITASDALSHRYFKEGVQPKTPKFFSSA